VILEALSMKIKPIGGLYAAALRKIDRLRDIIESQNDRIQELEKELEEAEEYDIYDDVGEEEWEELDVVVFLRDIGFDPDRLPSSVGDRRAIRDLLEAAKAVR
jgi:hypothetical protein